MGRELLSRLEKLTAEWVAGLMALEDLGGSVVNNW
jgi:hypothetical protein